MHVLPLLLVCIRPHELAKAIALRVPKCRLIFVLSLHYLQLPFQFANLLKADLLLCLLSEPGLLSSGKFILLLYNSILFHHPVPVGYSADFF